MYRENAGPSENVWTVDAARVEAAVAVVRKHLLVTPLVPAPSVHPRVWLKLETKQLTGSFKVRGALVRLSLIPADQRAAGIVTASAGNHGLGIAFAGRVLGVRARVFVPKHTPAIKRNGIAASGAEVIVTECAGYDETEMLARTVAEEEGVPFVSPYDDPDVAAGNGGTVGREIFDAVTGVDALVCPVGGGGLIAGLAAARDAWSPKTALIGVNAEASPGMLRSVQEGRALDSLEPVETLAEGLEGGVCPSTFAAVLAAKVEMKAVDEASIADAMRFAKTMLGEVVEGSGAVGIAWARAHADSVPGTGNIVVVATGRNVDRIPD